MGYFPFVAASGSGFANPMTTLGDLISGGSGGAAQRLAVGTNGEALSVVGGVPAWSAAAGGIAAGATLGVTQYFPAADYTITGGSAAAAIDPTNLSVTFTTAASGAGSTSVRARFCICQSYCGGPWSLGFQGTGGPANLIPQNTNGNGFSNDIYVAGLTPSTEYTWDLWGVATSGGDNASIYHGTGDFVLLEIAAGLT